MHKEVNLLTLDRTDVNGRHVTQTFFFYSVRYEQWPTMSWIDRENLESLLWVVRFDREKLKDKALS
jgi:hypothetical protein